MEVDVGCEGREVRVRARYTLNWESGQRDRRRVINSKRTQKRTSERIKEKLHELVLEARQKIGGPEGRGRQLEKKTKKKHTRTNEWREKKNPATGSYI